MNIFITSYDAIEAAYHLDDLRLNKMILETAQLLSSAFRFLFVEDENLYEITHLNHPCSLWARKDIYTYSWLVNYFDALSQEKYRRDVYVKGKNAVYHKSWDTLFSLFNKKTIDFCPVSINGNFFDFNCTEYKDEVDIRIAYQKQLNKKWQRDIRKPKWTASNIPFFFSNDSL